MIFTWEEQDIKSGIIVGKPGVKERWMIGYYAGSSENERYTLNSLSDGMVQKGKSKKDLAEQLTTSNIHPADVLDNPRFEIKKG